MTPPSPAPAARARRARWHRIVVPFTITALLLAVTWISHALDQPDPEDPGFLSPVDTGATGASRLAAELRAAGRGVARVTSTPEALRAAEGRGPLTLFVPAPSLVHPRYLRWLAEPARGGRVVLVDPPRRALATAGLPLAATERRWAARAVDTPAAGRPCPLGEVRRVGVAAALRQRYAGMDDGVDRCYQGGLARTTWRNAEAVVIGASDPFRNDRIDEWHNSELAVALLATHDLVLWLDLSGPEPPPPTFGAEAPSDAGPVRDQPGESDGESADEPVDDTRPGAGPIERDAPAADRAAGTGPDPLWDAFPPWFWAMLAQLALALLVLVLYRARRLGPPVAEPLPVTVRAAETALGRGRLYHRARARGPTARILRTAALHRLLPVLNLPPQTPPAEVTRAVAARTGRHPDGLNDLLYGPPPESERELLDLARALDELVHAAAVHPAGPPRPAAPRPDRSDEGEPR